MSGLCQDPNDDSGLRIKSGGDFMSDRKQSSNPKPTLEDLLNDFYEKYPGAGVEEDFFESIHQALKGYGKVRNPFKDKENGQEN